MTHILYCSDLAMEHYLIAIKLKPDLAEPHLNLRILYYNMKYMEIVWREVEKGLEITPDDQKAQQLVQIILHWQLTVIKNARLYIQENMQKPLMNFIGK